MASSDVPIVENDKTLLTGQDNTNNNNTTTTNSTLSSSINTNSNGGNSNSQSSSSTSSGRQLPKPPITPRGSSINNNSNATNNNNGGVNNNKGVSTISTPVTSTSTGTPVGVLGKQLPPITNIIRNRIDLEEREKENQQNIRPQQEQLSRTASTLGTPNTPQLQSIIDEDCFFDDEIQEYKTPPKQSNTSTKTDSSSTLPPPPPLLPSSMSKLAQNNVQSKINNINNQKGQTSLMSPPPPVVLVKNAPPPPPIQTVVAVVSPATNTDANRQQPYKPLPSVAKYKRDSVVIASLANLPPPEINDLKAFLDIYDNKILIVDSRAFSGSKSVSEQLISRFTLRTLAIDSILGRGCSGSVYLCSNENGEKLAVKIVTPTATFTPNVRAEYELMRSLEHESIMKVYDYFEMLTSLQPGSLFTMKYYENGDLRRLVEDYEKRERKISIHLIYDFIYQMASSLSFIHNQKIIHRDLPENIFMDKQTEHTCKIVLGDFGLAKTIQQSHGLFSIVGTMNYLSPEIVNNSEYGAETDIWSFGVVCYELMTLKSKQVERVVTLRQQGALVNDMLNRYPQEVTMIELIVKMLNKNPSDRPSADEILKQPCVRHFIEMKKVCEYIVQKLTESLSYFQKNYEFEKCIQIKDLLQSISQLRAESCDSSRLRISLFNAYTLLEEKLPENIDLRPTKPKVNLASSPEKQTTGKRRSNTKASIPSPSNHQNVQKPPSQQNQPNFRVTISGDESGDFHNPEESESSSGMADKSSNVNSLEHDDPNMIRKRSSSRNNIINQIKGWVGYGMEKEKSFKQNIVIKAPDPNKFQHEHHIGVDSRNRVSGNYPKDFDTVLQDMHMVEQAVVDRPPDGELKPRLHRRSTSLFEKPSINQSLDEIVEVSSPSNQRSSTVKTGSPVPPIEITKDPLSPTGTNTPSTPSNSDILKISPRFCKAGKLESSPFDTPVKSPNISNGVEIPSIGGAFKLISDRRQQDIIENYIEEACSSPTVSRRRR